MISKQKDQLLYKYDNPIIWNLSCFGNDWQLYILDNLLEILKRYKVKQPFSTIHGSYSCKYNGGRSAIYFQKPEIIKQNIEKYNNQGIGVKLTFSNANVHASTFEEKEMRWYLDILAQKEGIGNGIICVNDDFAELVKKNYPSLDLVASHVKMELETKMGITDTVDYYNSKFDLYDIVVFNTYRAFDDKFLSQIKYPDRVEFIVNHSCTTNCPMAQYHHSLIDQKTIRNIELNNDKELIEKDTKSREIAKSIKTLLAKCKEIKEQNIYEKLCRQFINKDEINHLTNTFGINRFKIEGRDLSNYEFIISLNRHILNNESMYDIIHNDYERTTTSLLNDINSRFID